jgi:hypothetical protein
MADLNPHKRAEQSPGGFIQKFPDWGRGLISNSQKFKLRREGWIRTFKVCGQNYIDEPFPVAMKRIAAEQAAAKERE